MPAAMLRQAIHMGPKQDTSSVLNQLLRQLQPLPSHSNTSIDVTHRWQLSRCPLWQLHPAAAPGCSIMWPLLPAHLECQLLADVSSPPWRQYHAASHDLCACLESSVAGPS